jgi:hypothetical protein
MDDLARFTVHLKSEAVRTEGRIYEQPQFAASYIGPLIHRLLSLSTATVSDVEDQGDALQEACRLASILYLAEIRRNFGILPVWSATQLGKLRSLLEISAQVWAQFGTLKLWVLAMGVVEAREEEQKSWFVERLGDASQVEGVQTMRQVVELLRQFLWIDDLHGSKFWRTLHQVGA